MRDVGSIISNTAQFTDSFFSPLPSDFYNYFQHGIDVLLSGTTHKVKKIILHSNVVSRDEPLSPSTFLTPR